MHKCSLLLPAVFSVALLFGCAEQQIEPVYFPPEPSQPTDLFILVPDENGKVGQITITNNAGSTTLSNANESAQVTNAHIPTRTTILSEPSIQKSFHNTLQAIPSMADQFTLFFSSGTTKLTQESQKKLPIILRKIEDRLPCEISIIGHSDTEANSEYNLALSLKRAIHVKNQLLAIGAPRDLLEVSSHGENDPLIPTADNVAEPKNRRVEIFIR